MDSPSEITKINPSNALYYHFSVDDKMLGPEDAVIRLKTDGCHRLTQSWVDEHWILILWKLASLVRAKPSLCGGKWTYEEVIRQLKYRYVPTMRAVQKIALTYLSTFRYEREYGNAQRSAIKRIQEQDSPASLPMVLCVSAVLKVTTVPQEEGATAQEATILELSDGWYRIRANADPPLQRALNAGRLAVGYKIAISGARVCLSSPSRIPDFWLLMLDERSSWTPPKKAQIPSMP